MNGKTDPQGEAFRPGGWDDAQIRETATAAGLTLPEVCLPGVRANLALLEDRWATVQAALQQIGEAQ